jgi:hypothetical protein
VAGTTWGYLCLHREATERRFTQRDFARLADRVVGVGRGSGVIRTPDPLGALAFKV